MKSRGLHLLFLIALFISSSSCAYLADRGMDFMDQSWVIMTTRLENWAYGSRDYKLGRKSFFLLPAVFTWVDVKQEKGEVWYTPERGVEFETDHYLWSRGTLRRNPYAVFHAFDVEFEIAIVAYLDLGFSPGETVDLLLGVLTIDLADDDGRVFKDGS